MYYPARVALFVLSALIANQASAQEAAPPSACSPAEFMAKEPDSILASDYTKIAFVRTATNEQYDLARQALQDKLNFGPMTGPVKYDQAQAVAEAEAQAIRFDFGAEYYESYLAQRIIGNVKEQYVECRRAQTVQPGLNLWLDRREGDYYFLHGIWIGNDSKSRGVLARNDIGEDEVFIVKIYDEWRSRAEREIVVKAGKVPGGMITISIGQQSQSFVFIADPERVRMLSAERPGPEMSVRSGGSASCERHTFDQCMVPKHINGYFVPGSTRFDGTQPTGTGFEITKETTSEVCVRVWALSAACQTEVRLDGKPVVVERYPVGP
jgi:hypothetical protein